MSYLHMMLDSLLPTPRRSLDWWWSLKLALRTLLWIPPNGKMDGRILKQLTKITSCNICHLCNNAVYNYSSIVCYEFPRWIPQNGKNNLEQKNVLGTALIQLISPKQRPNLPAAHGVVAPGEGFFWVWWMDAKKNEGKHLTIHQLQALQIWIFQQQDRFESEHLFSLEWGAIFHHPNAMFDPISSECSSTGPPQTIRNSCL